MKKVFVVLFGVILLASCSSDKDQAFCDCLTAGDKLNEYQQKLLQTPPNAEEQVELKKLRDEKNEACKDYELLDGETMRAKKSACEE